MDVRRGSWSVRECDRREPVRRHVWHAIGMEVETHWKGHPIGTWRSSRRKRSRSPRPAGWRTSRGRCPGRSNVWDIRRRSSSRTIGSRGRRPADDRHGARGCASRRPQDGRGDGLHDGAPRLEVRVYLIDRPDYFDRAAALRAGRGRLRRQLRAVRLLRSRGAGGDPAPGPPVRRHPLQRLADRPDPGLPGGALPPAPGVRGGRHAADDPQPGLSGVVLALGHAADGPRLAALQLAAARVPRPAELPEGGPGLRRPAEHRQPDLRPGDPDARVRLRARRPAPAARGTTCTASSTASTRRLEPERRADAGRPLRRRDGRGGQGGLQGRAAAPRGLPERPDVPLLAQIGRLDPQKGWDLLAEVADDLLRGDVQLVVLGDGAAALPRACSTTWPTGIRASSGVPGVLRARWPTRSRRGPTSS